MQSVREPAVAGKYYPNDPATLSALIDTFLVDETQVADGASVKHLKAIIAPHAGYIYSGAIAASAYAQLIPAASTINRVVLLGPCHRIAVRGLALSSADAFRTPLGDIPIDPVSYTHLRAHET